jgi:predicted nuclease of restriction endonuclease-like (RecB) superfamily
MSKKTPIPSDYAQALDEIKKRVRAAQYEALKAVNRELIALYWDIGRIIVERQQGKSWGKAIVERLGVDLRQEFPGMSGFSARNIWYMRKFNLCYRENLKLQPMVAEIGWTHNLIILDKCKDDLEREFYLRMTRKFGWTKNVLALRIQDQTYEKTLLGQTNFEKTLPETVRNQAKMQFYLTALDDRVRLPDENPSIGMILCREKKRAIVEYALKESNKPIGVAAYRIVRRLPAELKGKLPEPKQIERLLEAVELPKGIKNTDRRKGM